MGCMSETTVTKNDQQSRYEAHISGELAGFAEFRREGDVIVMPHTETVEAFSGQGVGSALARFALDDIACQNLSLIHISEPTRPCGTSRMPSSA